MIDIIFNDLSSSPVAADKIDGIDRMLTFISVLTYAFSRGMNGNVRTDTDFYLTNLSEGYSINDWVIDSDTDRDKKNYFLGIATKSPFLADLDERIQLLHQKIEIFIGELTSISLTASYLLESPLISFYQTPWDNPNIECDLHELDEKSGEIDITPAIPFINVSQVEHVEVHQDWIRKRLIKDLNSMADLWTNKCELLPHLDFCPDVEKQLAQINQKDPHFIQIINKLFQLEDYFSEWDDGPFDKDAFTKCNPVSPDTLKSYENDYTFAIDETALLIAHWHLYFTPGAGRIYFDANFTTHRCTICHIGGKLPDVTGGTY